MAGCIGDRKPDHAIFEPSWHHIYAVLGWTNTCAAEKYEPLYPGFTARHSGLARAINEIVQDDVVVADYRQDRTAFLPLASTSRSSRALRL
jgi:2,3-dihydroxyphenylpropionate 1,2-dioxygenase